MSNLQMSLKDSVIDNKDLIFKIILLGTRGVGKSNILLRYTKNNFSLSSHSTVGIEYSSQRILLPQKNSTIQLQIWDTAGQEAYNAITRHYYKNAVAAVLIFDITDRDSFEKIDYWINDLEQNADTYIIKLLVGNKCDLEKKRSVTKEEALQYAKQNDIGYVETSAHDGTNVKFCFEKLAQEIYESFFEDDTDISPQKLMLRSKLSNVSLTSKISAQNQLTNSKLRSDKKNSCC